MAKLFENKILLAVLSGLLLTIAWPPLSITPLLFVAFVPLLRLVSLEESVLKFWLYSYLSLLIWTLGTVYWIGNTRIEGQGFLVVSVAWLFIPLFQSLPIVIFKWIKNKSNLLVIWALFPLLWVSYEYLHAHWEFSFVWLHLGFGLSNYPWLIQFYEITGFLGGTFIIVCINTLVYLLWKLPSGANRFGYILAGFIGIIIIVNLILSSGVSKTDGQARVAIVQSNADPYEVLDKNSLKKQVGLLYDMLGPYRNANLDLVVLSEGYLRNSMEAPFVINDVDSHPAVKEIKKISLALDAPVLTGFIGFKIYDENDQLPVSAQPTGDGRYFSGFNGAMLIAHDQPTQIQMKNNLVPFMERIPYLEYLGVFEDFKLSINQARSSYGLDGEVNTFKYKNLKIGTLICLDAIYTDYATQFIDDNANVIAIIANDGWAGQTSGYHQNAEYASSVAASLDRSVVRSATTGQSMFVTSAGYKKDVTHWGERKVIVRNVDLRSDFSFYSSYGDWLGLVAIIISLAIGCYTLVIEKFIKRI